MPSHIVFPCTRSSEFLLEQQERKQATCLGALSAEKFNAELELHEAVGGSVYGEQGISEDWRAKLVNEGPDRDICRQTMPITIVRQNQRGQPNGQGMASDGAERSSDVMRPSCGGQGLNEPVSGRGTFLCNLLWHRLYRTSDRDATEPPPRHTGSPLDGVIDGVNS